MPGHADCRSSCTAFNTQDPRHRVIPLGYFIEEYWASQFLAHGDVFERYPELQVVISHCGAGLHRHPPGDRHLAQKDLSRNLFYDTSAYDLIFLEAGLKQHGVAQSLFGTEAPGSGGAPRPTTRPRPHDDLVPRDRGVRVSLGGRQGGDFP